MPQTTVSIPQAPSSATPAPAQAVGTAAPTSQPTPISQEQAEFLRARRGALTTQLESAQDRRNEVAEQLRDENLSGSERPGLENRLRVLDERLVSLEKEIATNSSQLANAPPRRQTSSTVAPNGDGGFGARRANPNLITVFTFALLMPFAIQLARRFFAPDRKPSRQQLEHSAEMQARMDRIESAVDSVAYEVERIGEAQRFLTQAMTEVPSRVAAGSGAPAFEPVPVRARQANDSV